MNPSLHKLITLQRIALSVLLLALTFGLEAQDSIPPTWNSLQLSGQKMKVLPAGKKKWLLPSSAALLGGGVVSCTLLYSEGEEPACEIKPEFQIQNPDCGLSNGSIIATLENPSGYSFHWSNGSASDTLRHLPQGEYQVTITELAKQCSDTFSVQLGETPLEIAIETLSPPSHPDAQDGFVLISINIHESLSYQIILNGNSYGGGSNNPFAIEGLGTGHYSLQIKTESGCTSNLIEFDMKPPVLSFSTTLTIRPIQQATLKPQSTEYPFPESNTTGWGVGLSANYRLFRQPFQTSLTYFAGGSFSSWQIEQLTALPPLFVSAAGRPVSSLYAGIAYAPFQPEPLRAMLQWQTGKKWRLALRLEFPLL